MEKAKTRKTTPYTGPYNGPTNLQKDWRKFAEAYIADSTDDQSAAIRSQHVVLLNELLFNSKTIEEFLGDTEKGDREFNRRRYDIQCAVEKLRDLSIDEAFWPLRFKAEEQLLSKWVTFRDVARETPDIQKIKVHREKKNAISEMRDADFLSNSIYYLLPIMPMCYSMLEKTKKDNAFTAAQIETEANALFPEALYAYCQDLEIPFYNYFKSGWLKGLLVRNLRNSDDTSPSTNTRVLKPKQVSLNLLVEHDDDSKDGELGDILYDKKAPSAPDNAVFAERWENLVEVMPRAGLTANEVRAIGLHLGLRKDLRIQAWDEEAIPPLTYEEVGQVMGCTRRSAQNYYTKGLQKLRLAMGDTSSVSDVSEEQETSPRITQEKLSECFTPGSDRAFYVDIEAQEVDRGIAMARFFKNLRVLHDLPSNPELAMAIAKKANLGDHVGKDINNRIHSLSVPEYWLDNPPKCPTLKRRLLHRLQDEPIATAIAQFAFPDDEGLQKQCVDFLCAERSKETDPLHRRTKSRLMGDFMK